MFKKYPMDYQCREEIEEAERELEASVPTAIETCENCCGNCLDRYVNCFWIVFKCICMWECSTTNFDEQLIKLKPVEEKDFDPADAENKLTMRP